MYTRRRRVLGLFGASILALSALLLLAPTSQSLADGRAAILASKSATPTNTTSATTAPAATATGTPSSVGQTDHPVLKSASSCAKAPKPSGSNPYIEYCSPAFGDNVEGPWGTHVGFVVSLGGKVVQQIYLFAVSPAANNECANIGSAGLTFQNGSLPALGLLVVASIHSSVNLSFDWTFPTNDFSTTSDYCLVLVLHGGDMVASSTGFSLLTVKPPCVVIVASGDTPECSTTQRSPLDVLQGQNVTIAGKNWLPGDQKQAIHVSLVCVQAPQGKTCPKNPIEPDGWSIKGTGADDIGGIWKLDNVQIPNIQVGTYMVQASMASDAITFGNSSLGDTQTFTLDIMPHPCISVSGDCVWNGSGTPQPTPKGKSVVLTSSNWSQGPVAVAIYQSSVTDCAHPNERAQVQAAQEAHAIAGTPNYTVPLPSSLKVNSTYTICASGMSSVASAGKVYATLFIKVTKPVTHQPFSLLSLLGLLFALVGAGVYVMTMPKRAVVPQPVGRR
ncbi:MAG TPA: hypothetical protein VJN88_11195 [Ktedonobacterales bacterium]|nr:hypothetical protein [Ktedonobacterales bacterium]